MAFSLSSWELVIVAVMIKLWYYALGCPLSSKRGGVTMVSFFLAVLAGVLSSVIAYYVCRAIDRYMGNE